MKRYMRFPLKASSLMIGLGLLIILATVVTGLTEAQQHASLFERLDDPGQLSLGFDPILIPEAHPVELLHAPTLPPQAIDQKGEFSPTSELPAAPPVTWSNPAAGEGPLPTATLIPIWIPDRIVIPAIQLDAPVIPATLKEVVYLGLPYQLWVAPNSFDVGQLSTSAPLGVAGNTVLIGHHNEYGEVFKHLVDLEVGDLIHIYSNDKEFAYVIVLKMILRERDQLAAVRLKNAQWIASSQDERLTLITCWPDVSNTHRLVKLIPRLTPDPEQNGK
jgi:LPXTG-site transpeptidase (sortase) family protein